MKRDLFIRLFTMMLVSLSSASISPASVIPDTVRLSAGYANEVYYNMDGGIVQTSPRNQWDIAFRTRKRSSGIITNDGTGVVLYTYPKADTSGWAAVDTSGLYNWPRMFNDPCDWENGAFSRNAKGHPDYGWAKYNEITHDLIGDSLFVIKLRDGNFKKLWIIRKYSSADIYYFRYADLNGAEEQTVNLDLSRLTTTDYYGFSMETNLPVSFEPPTSTWDLLFTKYMSVQTDGSPYLVTGVLSNQGGKAKKFHPVAPDYFDFGPQTWDSTRSSIGWDWKVFDMNTFTYQMVDSLVYFVKAMNGDIYKLTFTGFQGSTSGLISFDKEMVAGAGIQEGTNHQASLTVFPNPVKDVLTLRLNAYSGEDISVFLTDLSGRQLRADHPGRMADSHYQMDVSGLNPGVYFVRVASSSLYGVSKIIIQR